LTKFRYRWHPR